MRDYIKLLLAGMLFCMTGLPLLAQTTIKLVDSKTREPVPFAHVCFESLDKTVLKNKIADEKGILTFDARPPFQLAATSVGYATLIDTLRTGGTFTLYMEPTFLEMDEVVVTAQYSPRRVDQSIYNVKVIDNRKIREKGATNLSEALNNELGVRISNDAALGSSMSIQGLSGEHVKILIDGVPVIGRMNGNIDLSQINMYNVDHIEMVEGPMSVVYGSNALAGAVNIITKENTRGKFSSWLNSYVESVGVYNFDVGAAGNIGGHSVSLSGSRNFFAGFSEVDTMRSKQWKPRVQYNLDGYYKYQANRLGIKVDLRYFNETIQNKGPLLPPYREKAFDTYYYTQRWSDRIQADYKFSEGRLMDLIFAHSTYTRIKHTYFKDLTTGEEIMLSGESDNDTTRFTSYLLRGTFTDESISEKLSYQVGTDINIEEGQGKRIQDEQQSIGDYAVFASLQYEPSEKFSFQPGVRAGYNTNYKSPLVPSLNVRWNPTGTGKHIFRASYARGFRAPSLKELYLYFVDINHNLRGNPDLKAEYSHNVNLTWDYSITRKVNRFGLQAGLFYNNINNRITLALDSATVYSYINVDQYRTMGGKLNFKYRLHPRITFELGLFQVARQSLIREGKEFTTPFRYSTDVSSNITYNWIRRKLRFLITYKYTGKQPQFYSDENGDIEEGFIEGYHMLDASANKSFWNERILLGIGAKNLFDNTNIESSGLTGGEQSSGSGSYPVGWGRTFFISLRLYLNKY
ncbi:MAG: TonB-dependent receptor [Bacteroidales bacterium]|nr:TonB-dependent receptor [Bacteroidales bacterium]